MSLHWWIQIHINGGRQKHKNIFYSWCGKCIERWLLFVSKTFPQGPVLPSKWRAQKKMCIYICLDYWLCLLDHGIKKKKKKLKKKKFSFQNVLFIVYTVRNRMLTQYIYFPKGWIQKIVPYLESTLVHRGMHRIQSRRGTWFVQYFLFGNSEQKKQSYRKGTTL